MLLHFRKLKFVLCVAGFAVVASGASATTTMTQQLSASLAFSAHASEAAAAATHSGSCHHNGEDGEKGEAPKNDCPSNLFGYCFSFTYIDPFVTSLTFHHQSESFLFENSSGRPQLIKPNVDPPRTLFL